MLNRMLQSATALAFAVLVTVIAVPGCGDKGKETTKKSGGDGGTAKADDKKGGEEKKSADKEFIKAPTDAVVKGKITFDGKMPEGAVVASIKENKDKDVCMKGEKSEVIDQTWLGKDGAVANVLVAVFPPKGKSFTVDDKVLANFKSPATMDQPHCAFIPHTVAVFATYTNAEGKKVATGQKLEVKNSSPLTHNTKLAGDVTVNPPLNLTIPSGKTEVVELKSQKSPLAASCEFHPWMSAKIWALDTPYFAVTKEDGSFEIKGVPSGVELEVRIWHETHGNAMKTVESKTFKAGDNAMDLKVK